MDVKRIAKSTATVLSSYLTYEAVRIVFEQLQETNPYQAHWFNQFSARENIQNGDRYLQSLLQENQELAFRVMTVREQLANEVVDFLPEMARTGIQASNLKHRCQHLERMMIAPIPQGVIESELLDDSSEA